MGLLTEAKGIVPSFFEIIFQRFTVLFLLLKNIAQRTIL